MQMMNDVALSGSRLLVRVLLESGTKGLKHKMSNEQNV